MNRLIHISLTILIAATCTSVIAQTDTLHGSSIFHNATADPIEGERTIGGDIKTDTIRTLLRELHSLYSAGKFHEALHFSLQVLDKPHLTKAQNQDRLKYTLAAYKSIDYDHEADDVAKTFLQKDPFYTIQDDDPEPFKQVLDNYYTTPKYSVWAAVGKNIVRPHNDTIRSIIDTVTNSLTNSRRPYYSMNGWVIQVGFEYRPLKIITVSVAPSLTSYSIYRSSERTDIATFIYDESCQVLALPIFVEAGLHFGREIIVPSIYAGAQMKYVLRSEYLAYTDAKGIYTDIPDYKDDTDIKNRLNYSILGGIRLNYNRRRMTYFADLGISLDMLPYNDPKKIYSNHDLLYRHFHVPDVFQMREYTFKLGVKVNLKYKTVAKYNYGY